MWLISDRPWKWPKCCLLSHQYVIFIYLPTNYLILNIGKMLEKEKKIIRKNILEVTRVHIA